MRIEYITCKTRRTAVRRAPWAAMLSKVVGGWIAFESVGDYDIWLNQR
jgi:hypothetical protein